MTDMTPIQLLNRELADKLLDDAKRDPQAYAAKYVGIANGKVVVASNDLDELVRSLRAVEPDPANTFWVEIGRDYSKVCEIWEVS
jgi:hypothetical protein